MVSTLGFINQAWDLLIYVNPGQRSGSQEDSQEGWSCDWHCWKEEKERESNNRGREGESTAHMTLCPLSIDMRWTQGSTPDRQRHPYTWVWWFVSTSLRFLRPKMIVYLHCNIQTRSTFMKSQVTTRGKTQPGRNLKQASPLHRSMLNGFVKEVPATNTDKSMGGLSDYDECYGEERRFAKESPLKGKQWLNSTVSLRSSWVHKAIPALTVLWPLLPGSS